MKFVGFLTIIMLLICGCNCRKANESFYNKNIKIKKINLQEIVKNSKTYKINRESLTNKGILFRSIKTHGNLGNYIVLSGAQVFYNANSNNPENIDIMFENNFFTNLQSNYILTMNYHELTIYIHKILWDYQVYIDVPYREIEFRGYKNSLMFTNIDFVDVYNLGMLCLASNSNYILRENFIYGLVDFAKMRDNIIDFGYGGYGSAINLCNLYMKEFTDYPHYDEMELIAYFYSHWEYEYEGDVSAVYRVIYDFSNFIETHKDKSNYDVARMILANKYTYITHCRLTDEQREYFQGIVYEILTDLRNSKNERVQNEAIERLEYYSQHKEFRQW